MARYKAGLKTEAKILEATRHLLSEVGFEGTTLKAICDRAGIRAGSFYNLFGTKEEAIIRVVRESLVSLDPDPDREGRDTLDELIEAFITFAEANSSFSRIYLHIAVTGAMTDDVIRQRVLHHHAERVRRFGDAIAREHPSMTREHAESEAETLLATLHGLALRRAMDPEFPVAEHARRSLLIIQVTAGG